MLLSPLLKGKNSNDKKNQRYGMTDRMDPAETKKVWNGVKKLWESGMLQPTVYDQEYRGLEDVVPAMKELASRNVWGKAVVIIGNNSKPRL